MKMRIFKYIKKCKLTRRALAQFTYCTGQRQDKIVLLTGTFEVPYVYMLKIYSAKH